MKIYVGGIVVAVLAVFGLWFGIKRLRRLTNAVKSLRGKVVVITGASSGLGEACAKAFYAAGCKLVLCARRVTELERVKIDLEAVDKKLEEDRVKIVAFDLAELSNINAAVAKVIACYGQVDILINNGGLSYRGSIEETSLEVDISVMNVNYFGQVAVTKALLPHLLKRKSGQIVAIGSIQSKLALPFRSAYSASKHALQSFFDSLRAEVAADGVRVSVIHPGYIKTSLSLNAMTALGNAYGKMDETQAAGMSAEYVANQVLNAVALQQNEVLIAPLVHRVVTYLRNAMPDTICREMARRAGRQSRIMKKSS